VAIPPAHEGAPQITLPFGYVHAAAVVPSHAPPHAEPSVLHATRVLRGMPLTGVQMPSVSLSLHASHCPLQPVSQQTPSEQCVLAH
jgi:hypothetical protein